MLITPSAMSYDTITSNDIVTLDLDGQVLAGHRKPSIEWELHLNIYRARPDVGAVVHTHGIYSTAFAVCQQPLLPFMVFAILSVLMQLQPALKEASSSHRPCNLA